mmetsp:Transcript_65362/g.142456  ORF Transcript_65362/g.142456 Transcript_65362/m.142456 type:complete len:86 (+) Transcript_65362:234-491(+)
MDKLANDPKYADKVIFLLVNLRGIDDASKYVTMKSLSEACRHGANRPPEAYGIKYIPHKTLIDSKGVVVKNFDNVHLSTDVASLL